MISMKVCDLARIELMTTASAVRSIIDSTPGKIDEVFFAYYMYVDLHVFFVFFVVCLFPLLEKFF